MKGGSLRANGVKLRILGAAGEVTGSNYMIDTKGYKVLVDCGFHQGQDEEKHSGEPFTYNPADMDAVLLTHAHIDHSGRIPLLVKQGFKGKIYCTFATRELVSILWQDSLHLMLEEAEFRTRKNTRKGLPPVEPLYGEDDVNGALKMLTPVQYDEMTEILPGLKARFREAGHILGSATIETWVSEEGTEKPVKVVFSGDLGPFDGVIEKPPVTIEDGDYVLIESTYGDRLHKSLEETRREFQDAVKDALAHSGKILVPTFVVDRAQRMLYEFDLFQKTFPDIKTPTIYLDSPMGVKTTEIYSKYDNLLSKPLRIMLENGDDPFQPENFKFVRTPDESRAVNALPGGIILAGSGMCSGGRIMHHLKHNIFKPDTHIFFVGYQAYGTTGRRIVDGAKEIRIAGEDVRVKAKIDTLNGFSAHADRDDLLKWASALPKKTRFIVVHGEPKSSESLAYALRDHGYQAMVPAFGDEIELRAQAKEEQTLAEPMISPKLGVITNPQEVEQTLASIMERVAGLQSLTSKYSDYSSIMPLLTSAKTLLETAREIEERKKKSA